MQWTVPCEAQLRKGTAEHKEDGMVDMGGGYDSDDSFEVVTPALRRGSEASGSVGQLDVQYTGDAEFEYGPMRVRCMRAVEGLMGNVDEAARGQARAG